MLAFRLILCPSDFSEPSQKALEAADELASHFSAELLLVHIVPFLPPIPATPDVTFNLAEYEALPHADAEAGLLKLRNALSAKHPKVRTLVGHRPAAEEIVRIAKQENADLIVIAAHGETGFERVVFGLSDREAGANSGLPGTHDTTWRQAGLRVAAGFFCSPLRSDGSRGNTRSADAVATIV
jgi:nucleotide-binding universal stress UspA family protein